MYNIKEARKNKGFTQNQLSKELNVHQTAVSQWERGKTQPRSYFIPKILKILDCKIEDIYREE